MMMIYKKTERRREVGILFSADMARAIWLGQKWQTRRLVGVPESVDLCETRDSVFHFVERDGYERNHSAKPRMYKSNIMIVREPWRVAKTYDHLSPTQLGPLDKFDGLHYEADGPQPEWAGRYRHAMHMTFLLARSRRRVTGVRVERLGDISEADAEAEGVVFVDREPGFPCWRYLPGCYARTAREGYSLIWDFINGAGSWERDVRKWVFVYAFEKRGT